MKQDWCAWVSRCHIKVGFIRRVESTPPLVILAHQIIYSPLDKVLFNGKLVKPQPCVLWSVRSNWHQQDTPRYLRACVKNATLANEELQLARRHERWNWAAVAVHVVIMCITSNESIKDQKQLPKPVKVNTLMSLVSLSQLIMSATNSPWVVFLLGFLSLCDFFFLVPTLMIQVGFKRQNERQKAKRIFRIAISLAFKPCAVWPSRHPGLLQLA